MSRARICLVTPSHVTCNPRLTKEADALHEAGYEVHVVAGRYFPVIDAADEEILIRAAWRYTRVDFSRGARANWAKVLRRVSRAWLSWRPRATVRCAISAHHAAAGLLVTAAARVPADLYIGHGLAGLAAAAGAAARRRAAYAFDAEDFHTGETAAAERDTVESRLVRRIESALLPGCAHLTAASPLIARAYDETYKLANPAVTVLNVFPRHQAPAMPVQPDPTVPARLYWFSQTVGPGRGLEELVAALGRTDFPCALYLRGFPAEGFPDALRLLAQSAGFRGPIEFQPFGAAAEMVRLAAGYDLGLSLEQPTPRNRDLCLTNKIFTYLLAGVPVALTPTSAQRDLSPHLGRAAVQLDLSVPAAAAAVLAEWLRDRAGRREAHAEAWRLGQEQYNWDTEKSVLLRTVEHTLNVTA